MAREWFPKAATNSFKISRKIVYINSFLKPIHVTTSDFQKPFMNALAAFLIIYQQKIECFQRSSKNIFFKNLRNYEEKSVKTISSPTETIDLIY
jgi:hypothetical protein